MRLSTPWWRRLSAEIQACHGPLPIGSLFPTAPRGHVLAAILTTTWLLTIPAGQLALRNISGIYHTSTPKWGKLTASNPVSIHIGFLTIGPMTPHLTPANSTGPQLSAPWTQFTSSIAATHNTTMPANGHKYHQPQDPHGPNPLPTMAPYRYPYNLRRGGVDWSMDGGGGNPNVNIGNYKGVMLCNRPFNGVASGTSPHTRVFAMFTPTVTGPATAFKDTDYSSKNAPFLTGIHPPTIGQNHAIKRDKKNTALSKHKKWLHDLQKERDRLEEALMEDEDEKQLRRDRFSKREADFRAQVRRTNPEEDGADPKGARRPMWALTKETADEKKARDEDEDVDDLLEFANNLDLDSFMDDVELKAHVAQVNEQLSKLQAVVNQEEGEEKKSEIKDMLNAERAERQTLNAAALSRLDGADSKGVIDDDAASVASSIRSVHSTRSVMALTRRAEDKLLSAKLASVPEGGRSGIVPTPHVVTHDEECGMRLQNKLLPSNLPYIHRNPAI
ncbi:hypothetical protein DYB37_000410 [Aphanomyces astaci]|uniref:Uncharacterized protein n=1 Tax=Aphanomyces astaci TaxID=112090 RepID=A0A3R7A627_APHAT|nr:hypothetical protein DYB35_000216 [Aphanomyces astaci]RHZ25579.1 hypothetical protein DYB37_000410 [Aphanomyces astaci]